MIQNHVVTFETAKKLKEAGFPQGAHFYWREFHQPAVWPNDIVDISTKRDDRVADVEFVAAPLATEILAELRPSRRNRPLKICINNGFYTIGFENSGYIITHQNLAEAVALIWLKNEKCKE